MKANGRTGIYKLLLEKNSPLSKEPDIPIYETQSELVKLIVDDPENNYNEFHSLKGYLNQILLGRRRCGEDMAEAVIKATLQKLKESKLPQSKIEEVLRSQFEEDDNYFQKRKSRRQSVNDDRDEIETKGDDKELLDAQARAKSIFIINKSPLDLLPEENADISSLKLITINKIVFDKIPHTYCVSDEDTAIKLWWYFFNVLLEQCLEEKSNISEEIVSNICLELEQWEREGTLSIFVIQGDKCVFPVVLYDAEHSTENAFIYHARIEIDGEFKERCIMLDHEQRSDFKLHFYKPIAYSGKAIEEIVTWAIAKSFLSGRMKI